MWKIVVWMSRLLWFVMVCDCFYAPDSRSLALARSGFHFPRVFAMHALQICVCVCVCTFQLSRVDMIDDICGLGPLADHFQLIDLERFKNPIPIHAVYCYGCVSYDTQPWQEHKKAHLRPYTANNLFALNRMLRIECGWTRSRKRACRTHTFNFCARCERYG